MAKLNQNLCSLYKVWPVYANAKSVNNTLYITKNKTTNFWLLFILTFILIINYATAAPQNVKISKAIVIERRVSNSTIELPTSVTLPSMSNKRLRKRHSKRHSNWFDYVNLNSTNLEWVNPCGGFYTPTGTNTRSNQTPNKFYNLLKRTAHNELNTLKSHQQLIDINNIQIWKMYDYAYKFLPKLKINSTIALKRWYRNMQTYVASFGYLRRVQLKWDREKSQRDSNVARELERLLDSSRTMLCELEAAINGTRAHSDRKKFDHLTREQMEKRLKLRTKKRLQNPNIITEPDNLDLKFVKHYFYEFLETMWKVLRRAARSNNKLLKAKKQLQRQQRKQQQQQAFNEVDKVHQRREHKGSRRNNSTLRKHKKSKQQS